MLKTFTLNTMDQFTQRNAITATLFNLVINTVAPFLIFSEEEFINLKGESPTVVSLLMPTVMISVFATTLATFITMTKQRMAHKLEPTLEAHTSWLPTAVLTSIGLGMAFAGLGFGLLWVLQSSMANAQIPKLWAILLSGIVGAFAAFIASFIAVKRARLIC
ncbi:MAG: hypothetical protein JWP57_2814 [Spirosoma sp.]|nr:hypothetical protein [Spirosoma sp.]